MTTMTIPVKLTKAYLTQNVAHAIFIESHITVSILQPYLVKMMSEAKNK